MTWTDQRVELLKKCWSDGIASATTSLPTKNRNDGDRMTKSECWANAEWRAAHWGNRKGRPWTEAEYNKALTMRFYRKTDAQIAAELDRTEGSVMAKLGYWRTAA